MNAPPEPAFLMHWEPDQKLSPSMRRGKQDVKVPEVDEKKLDQNSSSGVLLSVQDMNAHVIMALQMGAGRLHQYKIPSLLVGDMNGRVVREFQMGGKPEHWSTPKLLLGLQDMNAPVVADFQMRGKLDKISSPTLLMNASMVTELHLGGKLYQINGNPGLHVCDRMHVPVSAISSLSDSLEVQEGSETGMMVYKRRPKDPINSTAKTGQGLNEIVSTRTASHTAIKEPRAEVDNGEHMARRRFLSILRKFEDLRRRFRHQHELGLMTKKTARNCDMKAGSLMMRKQENYNFIEGVGHVPGVRVGDCFSHRFEIFLTGLHGQVQAGISYIPAGSEPSRKYYHGQSVACSVVASGDYAISTSNSNSNSGETLTFLGQGFRNEHQKADTANLAIINSFRMRLPVRVIRSYKASASPSGRLYSYDGLYMVESFMKEMGPSGFQVYKFFMRRKCGQPSARLHVVRLLNWKPAEQEDLLTADISEGAEPVPVCVVNTLDVDCPDPFHYTSTVWYSDEFLKLPSPTSCKCTHGCQDSSCPCVAKNHGRELAYNLDGCLVQVLDIVFECGKFCRCGEKCHNKVSQKGMQRRLQIFKTAHKGWGVRSLEGIPRGSFVCELTGELITATTASERENDEYLFDLDFKRGAKVRWADTPNSMTRVSSSEGDETGPFESSADYVIDARKYGNVARFINHSCDPNLFVQGVLFDHDDLNRGHLMLFASDNVRPFSELAYDYGYELDSVLDRHGNVRERACHCGAPTCRKRLY